MDRLIKVLSVTAYPPRRLQLQFSDGRGGAVELSDRDLQGALAQIKNPETFRQVSLRHGVPCWGDSADIAPEYLYFLCFKDDPALRPRFEAWGYTLDPLHA